MLAGSNDQEETVISCHGSTNPPEGPLPFHSQADVTG
jgi:hypothetical protein